MTTFEVFQEVNGSESGKSGSGVILGWPELTSRAVLLKWLVGPMYLQNSQHYNS